MLWLALMLAKQDGTTVPDLMTATGMSRPWIYTSVYANSPSKATWSNSAAAAGWP